MSVPDPKPDPLHTPQAASDGGVAVALLAAGRSRRFDGRKLVADLSDMPLWQHAARAVEAAGFARRILICREGAADDFARQGWEVVENPQADRGMGTSIAKAATACRDNARLVIALADMPFVDPAHLRALAEARTTVFTRYPDGSKGVPAAFVREDFASLVDLRGGGARQLSLADDAKAIAPPVGPTLLDIDTREDLAKARRIARGVAQGIER